MLQIVRSETLRGLEGRALAGFWAGGRVYGYRTVREEWGAAICGNGLVISERKLNRAVIDELRKLLASKEIQARFVDGFKKRIQNKNPADDRERAALEAEVKAQESRVRNVTAAIARSGFSEARGTARPGGGDAALPPSAPGGEEPGRRAARGGARPRSGREVP